MIKSKEKVIILSFLVVLFMCIGDLFSLTIKDASTEELSIESDLIIVGQVKSIKCIWENESLKRINTVIKVEILEYLKGESTKELQIVQMGGGIDDIEDIIVGTPKLKKGDEVILFLVLKNKNYEIHSIALGCYKVILDKNNNKMAINDLRNVHLVSENFENTFSGDQKIKSFDFLKFRKSIKSTLKQK